jgi:8-oxo-dGTP diphosphatase
MVIVEKNPTVADRLLFVVAAALIDAEGQVLVQQRPEGQQMAGLWEFPGGKAEPSEAPVAALVRELDEELGIAPAAPPIPLAFADEPLGDRHLVLLLYAVHHWTGTPAARDGQRLAWVAPAELGRLAMPPADVPLVERLLDYFAASGPSRPSAAASDAVALPGRAGRG